MQRLPFWGKGKNTFLSAGRRVGRPFFQKGRFLKKGSLGKGDFGKGFPKSWMGIERKRFHMNGMGSIVKMCS